MRRSLIARATCSVRLFSCIWLSGVMFCESFVGQVRLGHYGGALEKREVCIRVRCLWHLEGLRELWLFGCGLFWRRFEDQVFGKIVHKIEAVLRCGDGGCSFEFGVLGDLGVDLLCLVEVSELFFAESESEFGERGHGWVARGFIQRIVIQPAGPLDLFFDILLSGGVEPVMQVCSEDFGFFDVGEGGDIVFLCVPGERVEAIAELLYEQI